MATELQNMKSQLADITKTISQEAKFSSGMVVAWVISGILLTIGIIIIWGPVGVDSTTGPIGLFGFFVGLLGVLVCLIMFMRKYNKTLPLQTEAQRLRQLIEAAEKQQVLNSVANSTMAINTPPTTLTATSTEALSELKKLLDNGVITQEDFDKKKSQILERL